jgi:hypothetical protein
LKRSKFAQVSSVAFVAALITLTCGQVSAQAAGTLDAPDGPTVDSTGSTSTSPSVAGSGGTTSANVQQLGDSTFISTLQTSSSVRAPYSVAENYKQTSEYYLTPDLSSSQLFGSCTSPYVASTATATCTIAQPLTDQTTYYVRSMITGQDGATSPWSPTSVLTTWSLGNDGPDLTGGVIDDNSTLDSQNDANDTTSVSLQSSGVTGSPISPGATSPSSAYYNYCALHPSVVHERTSSNKTSVGNKPYVHCQSPVGAISLKTTMSKVVSWWPEDWPVQTFPGYGNRGYADYTQKNVNVKCTNNLSTKWRALIVAKVVDKGKTYIWATHTEYATKNCGT